MKTKEDFKKEPEVMRIQRKVDTLRPMADKESEDNERKLYELLAKFTTFKLRIYVHKAERNYVSLEVNFVKPDGNDDFGSDFRIYWYGEGYSTYHGSGLELSCGTIGSYSKKYIYNVERAKVIARIWENIDEVEEFFKTELNYVMNELWDDYNRQLIDTFNKLEWDEQERIKHEIAKAFVPGNKITLDDYEYAIEKVTPKRVYYTAKFLTTGTISARDTHESKERLIDLFYYNLDKTNLGIQ